MASENIKKVVADFVNFNIDGDYYKKDEKKELAINFGKILFEDDAVIRQYLKKLFDSAKKLAGEFDLIAKSEEAKPEEKETPDEENKEIEGEAKPEENKEIEGEAKPEEKETPEDETKKAESIRNKYNKMFESRINAANNFLV